MLSSRDYREAYYDNDEALEKPLLSYRGILESTPRREQLRLKGKVPQTQHRKPRNALKATNTYRCGHEQHLRQRGSSVSCELRQGYARDHSALEEAAAFRAYANGPKDVRS